MSDILIRGMEMPECHFKTSESYNVHGFLMVYPDGKAKLHIMVGNDHLVCDVTTVPDHGRLVDADAAVGDIRSEILEIQMNGMKGTPMYVEDLRTMWQRLEDEELIPTVIPASE